MRATLDTVARHNRLPLIYSKAIQVPHGVRDVSAQQVFRAPVTQHPCATENPFDHRLGQGFPSHVGDGAAKTVAFAGSAIIAEEPQAQEYFEDICEQDRAEGFITFTFDPITQQRVDVKLNSRTAALVGMHKEEASPF